MPAPGICLGTPGSTAEWRKAESYCTDGTLGWATGGDNV